MLKVAALRMLLAASCLALIGCSTRGRGGGGGGGDDDDSADDDDDDDDDAADDDDAVAGGGLITGLDLVGVSINQGVEVRLLDNRTDWINNRNADIVPNRPGLLRVYVEPQADWDSRVVVATVEFEDGTTRSVKEAVGNGASSETSLSSTLNIELSANDLAVDQGISVRLEELGDASYPGESTFSQWPPSGYEDLDLRSSGVVDLRIIPIRYQADGSNRMPDTSSSALGIIEDQMMKLYPASEIRVTVEATMNWPSSVQPNGAGWSELLQELYYERYERNMPSSTYTYGLFAPAQSQAEFCGWGCVAGLSINVQSAGDGDSRVSMGLGYGSVASAETLVHEIGHAHGRNHAPCTDAGTIQNVDPSFPYSDGSLGVVGYDIIDGALKDPDSYADLMGYCDPLWVSDYTWRGFHERIRAVGPQSRVVGDVDVDLMSVIVDGDGARSPKRTRGRLLPADRELTVLDVDGTERIEGARFLPFDHLDGGLLVFPAPSEDALAIDVPGYGLIEL